MVVSVAVLLLVLLWLAVVLWVLVNVLRLLTRIVIAIERRAGIESPASPAILAPEPRR